MRILCCLQIAVMGLLLSHDAMGAVEPPPEAAHRATPRPILVLNVTEDSYPQDDLRSFVSTNLAEAGVQLVDPTTLTPAGRSCEESSCMRLLAANYRVDLILTVRIERTTDDHLAGKRDVNMWLYDNIAEGKLVREFCRPDQLESCLGNMAKRLLGLIPQDVVESTPPLTPLLAVVTSPPPLRGRLTLASRRVRIAMGLGSISLGTLASAISLHALTGTLTDNDGLGHPGHYVYSYPSLFVPLYATAGALAVGTALTLFWPSKKEAHTR